MRRLAFTFKDEAKWMLILSLGPLGLGFIVLMVIWLLRALR